MRFSYKKIVDRFQIPRPTLIEWQKRVKTDRNNWRVKHLNYLREQVEVEEMTFEELKTKPIRIDDIFLLSVFLFFHPNYDYVDRNNFKREIRNFAYANRSTLEYRHDFAMKIWSIKMDDDTGRRIANYYSLIDILDSLTIAQYTIFIKKIKEFLHKVEVKLEPTHNGLLDGLTWQEIYMYDKAFSDKALRKQFSDLVHSETGLL